jgi:hypothetical protein
MSIKRNGNGKIRTMPIGLANPMPLWSRTFLIQFYILFRDMGNSNSISEEDAAKVGYRVLGVQANSPAAKGGLVSFFDFIVQANGIPLRSLDSTFIDLIKVCFIC